MPLRILFVAQRFSPDIGGLARSGARTVHALAALGAVLDVVAWTRALPPGRVEASQAGPGVTLHRVGQLHAWDATLQTTDALVEWLHRRRGFDLVWGHYAATPGFFAVLFAEQARLPSVVSVRGNDVDQEMLPPGDFARLAWTLGRARVISAASADLARKVEMVLGRKVPIEIVPNVVSDLDTFAPCEADPELRLALGIDPGESVLGFSGELRLKKGFPFLLAALVEVRRRHPACLLVIGDIRPRERSELAAFALDQPEAAARVLVTGPLEEPREIAARLALCDVYLQPSLWEGMPNALLEAMACGRCVLASDAGGIREVVEHGRSGFLVPRAELHRLGEATLELLALPPAARATIGAAARARVESDFHAGVEAAALGRVLERATPMQR